MSNKESELKQLVPDEILVKIFDMSYEWTEEDNRYLIEAFYHTEIPHYQDTGRWNYPVEVIVKIDTVDYGERYFRTGYDCGWVDHHDNEIWDARPVEVMKRTYTKTIEVTEWREVLVE